MSGLTLLPAVDLLGMMQDKKISVVEMAEEFLQEIGRLNPRLNAIVDHDAAQVRARAKALQDTGGPSRPLYGLPMTVKSSIATAGHRCEIGSVLHRGEVPTEDAPVVARLRDAGALLLGTTNCPEFLMAYETDNLLYGRTANPWDMERTPGGSSGGEAAAIAAGISAGGLGSDSGGSVRVPAHFSGICSLKPTPGRVPGRGHLPPCVGPFSILGAIGPMARTVADVTLLFRVLASADPLDPVAAPVQLRQPTQEEVRRVPIGYFVDDGETPVTEETRRAVEDAAQALRKQGFQVRPFRPRVLEQARRLWWTFFVGAGAMFLEQEVHGKKKLISPVLREFLEIAKAGPPLTGNGLLQAWAECDVVRGKLLAEMQQFPLLLCPVCAVPAFRHGERSWEIRGQKVEYLDAMRYTQWWNVLAAPAAVVPVGRSPEGLPIGVQVVGRPYADEEVLVVAAAIEREFERQTPPLTWANEAASPAQA